LRLRRGADPDNLRIVAAVLDTVLAIPACVLVYIPIAIPSGLVLDGPPPAEPLVVAGMLMYFFAFEAFGGWTPGKRLLGLRVIRRDGGQPGAAAIAARNLLRPLDYLGSTRGRGHWSRQRPRAGADHAQRARSAPRGHGSVVRSR
jgi:uncharacterized RDD family membrane protein YckC